MSFDDSDSQEQQRGIIIHFQTDSQSEQQTELRPQVKQQQKKNIIHFSQSEQQTELRPQVKQQQDSQKSVCLQWLANPFINPVTGRKITEQGKIYQEYFMKCEKELLLLPKREIKVEMSQDIETFMKKDGHLREIYLESVWKTIGKKHNLCFLHPISVKFVNVRRDYDFDTNFQYWNIPHLRPRFFVFSHFGRYTLSLVSSTKIADPYGDPYRLIPEKYTTDEIAKCNNPKLMAILIHFPGHTNMLVINNERKEIEHFEPEGTLNEPSIANLFSGSLKHLGNLLFPGYNYIEPLKLCPKFRHSTAFKNGFQSLSPYPYMKDSCSLWSIWYAYSRLSNPLIDRDEIIEIAVKTIESTAFTTFIKNMLKGLTSWVNLEYNSEANSYTFQGKTVFMSRENTHYPIFQYEQQEQHTKSRVQAQSNQRRNEYK